MCLSNLVKGHKIMLNLVVCISLLFNDGKGGRSKCLCLKFNMEDIVPLLSVEVAHI